MKKITYTFYTKRPSQGAIADLVTARRIRIAAIEAGQTMADWARELGVSRQYIHAVVNGRAGAATRVKAHIEQRLGQKFWEGAA